MKKKILHQELVYDRDSKKGELGKEYKLVLDIVGKNKDVLEFGCHTGYFTKLLVDRGCKVVGVELDYRAAEKAKNIVDKVVIGDIEDDKTLNQINEKFDAILFMHILEHLINPWRVLVKVEQYLKPEGKVLVAIPNVACWSIRKDLFFKGKFEYVDLGILDRTHLRFFTFETAQELLRQSGYQIVNWEITQEAVPLAGRLASVLLLRRLIPYWKRFMLDRCPNLCGAVFVFEAKPIASGADDYT